LAPTLYHSGRSQDVAAVAQNLIEQDRISRFALAGFSMGGNPVLKLAGEWGPIQLIPRGGGGLPGSQLRGFG
jgi:predicted alpha/beta-fold hydrolase